MLPLPELSRCQSQSNQSGAGGLVIEGRRVSTYCVFNFENLVRHVFDPPYGYDYL